MKNILPVLLACIFAMPIFAQSTGNPISRGTFIIKGKVKHPAREFLELGITGFIGSRSESVPIAPNGAFSKTISIINMADIFLDIDGVDATIFVLPGDVLELSWDDVNPASSFRIKTKSPDRQKELDQMIALSRNQRASRNKLFGALEEKGLTEQDKYHLIRSQFADELQTALKFPMTANCRKVYSDIYFHYTSMLANARLLQKYELHFTDVMSKPKRDSLGLAATHFTIVDEPLFLQSGVYRDFIFNQVRFNKVFNGWRALDPAAEKPSNFALEDCYAGMAALGKSNLVTDWFLTYAIINGFGSYPFEGPEESYKVFHDRVTTAYFRDTLTKFYTAIQRLRPGNAAPAFTLKNLVGKTVSLSDFKNKVVYVDFWGVDCGPCMFQIKNHAPKLHARYKNKDVVFLNICVDTDEIKWKSMLKTLNFEGIQLIAEGWTKNQACIDYNVNAIPQYVLIDKQGKLVSNSADRPSELLLDEENEIDALLKK